MVDVTRFKATGDTSGVTGSIGGWIKSNKLLATSIAGVTAAAAAFKAEINYGDMLEKTAQKTGLAVETLSRWKLGAELAGTSQEGLISGLQRLQKNMGAALRSPTSASAQAFKDLGIAFQDAEGRARPVEAVARDMAQAFAGMEDGSDKTRIAMDLMGRSGADLIPFLNQGTEGIREMEAISDALGVTWSQVAATDAANFNDSLTIIQTAGHGLFSQAAQFWIPTLAGIAEGFEKAALASAGLSDTAGLEGRALIEHQIAEEQELINELMEQQVIASEKLNANASIGEQVRHSAAVAAMEDSDARITAAQARLRSAKLLLENYKEEESAVEHLRKLAEEAEVGRTNAIKTRTRAQQEGRDLTESAARAELRALEGIRAKFEHLGMTEAEVIQQQAVENASLLVSNYEALGWSVDDLSSKLQALREQEDAALSALLERQDASAGVYERSRTAAIDYSDTALSAASSAAQGVGQLARTAADGAALMYGQQSEEAKRASRIAFAAEKAAAFATATVHMAQAIAAANSLGYPQSIPAMAAAGITGGIQLGTIAATSIAGAVADAGMTEAMLGKARARGISQVFNLSGKPETIVDSRGTAAISDMLESQRDERLAPAVPQQITVRPVVAIEEVGASLDSRTVRQRELGINPMDARRF